MTNVSSSYLFNLVAKLAILWYNRSMEIFEAIKTRRSVRSYKSDPVPEEKLNKVLEAGRLAPSARNGQNWKFIVVRDEKKRKELAQAAHNRAFVGKAPIVIAAVSLEPEDIMSCQVPTYAVDLAIAVDHMTLQAVAEGLGTCWIGAFSQEDVKRVLNIPENYKVAILLVLGFPSDKPGPKTRKDLKEIISYESFQ